MINKTKFMLIAAIAASSIALPAVALAQSAYTAGTPASRAAAGYPSPYGYGSGLNASAPGHFTATPFQLAYGGHNFDRTVNPFADDTPLSCGRGRVPDPQSNQCRGPADISTDELLARFVTMPSSLRPELF